MSLRDRIDREAEDLRVAREELRLRLHLGKLEARDLWEQLEKKWQQLEPRLAEAKDDIVETSRTVGAGLEVVAEELGAAYRRIRERLTGS